MTAGQLYDFRADLRHAITQFRRALDKWPTQVRINTQIMHALIDQNPPPQALQHKFMGIPVAEDDHIGSFVVEE